MLKNRLARAGFTVIVATNGAQGVAMASFEKPDLCNSVPSVFIRIATAPSKATEELSVLDTLPD
jgi:hypothetical protein